MNQQASFPADSTDGTVVSLKDRLRRRAVLLVIVPLMIVALAWFIHVRSSRYEVTDDAYAQAGKLAVSTEIDGRVVSISVKDEEPVSRGQILFRLDPEPYEIAVRQAEAGLASAQLDVRSLGADARSSAATAASANEQLAYAQREASRQRQLLAEGISSKSQFDQAMLAVQDAQQKVVGSNEATASIEAKLGAERSPDQNPRILSARAALDAARRDLRNTLVRAAQDGIVGQVSQLQVGQYVQRGRALFTLVGSHVWVVANFKEDQLAKMQPGQKANIRFDAFPGSVDAHVAAFSPGTGSSFSMLPAENATGNWVKVVQRLPVRLEIDNPPPARKIVPGLSATVKVDVRTDGG